jgi:hypothetical protein
VILVAARHDGDTESLVASGESDSGYFERCFERSASGSLHDS